MNYIIIIIIIILIFLFFGGERTNESDWGRCVVLLCVLVGIVLDRCFTCACVCVLSCFSRWLLHTHHSFRLISSAILALGLLCSFPYSSFAFFFFLCLWFTFFFFFFFPFSLFCVVCIVQQGISFDCARSPDLNKRVNTRSVLCLVLARVTALSLAFLARMMQQEAAHSVFRCLRRWIPSFRLRF